MYFYNKGLVFWPVPPDRGPPVRDRVPTRSVIPKQPVPTTMLACTTATQQTECTCTGSSFSYHMKMYDV